MRFELINGCMCKLRIFVGSNLNKFYFKNWKGRLDQKKVIKTKIVGGSPNTVLLRKVEIVKKEEIKA